MSELDILDDFETPPSDAEPVPRKKRGRPRKVNGPFGTVAPGRSDAQRRENIRLARIRVFARERGGVL